MQTSRTTLTSPEAIVAYIKSVLPSDEYYVPSIRVLPLGIWVPTPEDTYDPEVFEGTPLQDDWGPAADIGLDDRLYVSVADEHNRWMFIFERPPGYVVMQEHSPREGTPVAPLRTGGFVQTVTSLFKCIDGPASESSTVGPTDVCCLDAPEFMPAGSCYGATWGVDVRTFRRD